MSTGFQVGDRITGRDASNRHYTGTVAEVFPEHEAMFNRYRLVDTGEHYGDGSPVEPILVTADPAWRFSDAALDGVMAIDPYDEDAP